MRLMTFILLNLVSGRLFCQGQEQIFINEDKVLTVANNYRHFNLKKTNQHGWMTEKPQLDTVKAIWQVTASKLKIRDWGRTTKNYDSDFRRHCKEVNGCRVRTTKTILIDATSGRVISIKRDKRITGNYE